MAPLTFEQLVVLLGMIGTGIAFMFGKPFLDSVKSFGDWWVESRHRRLEMEAKHRQLLIAEREQEARAMSLDDELNDKGHKYIIRRQDRRITELEKLCVAFQAETHNCREDYASLTTKCQIIEQEGERMRAQLAMVTNRLELLAPGISNASDSKVARYFQRLENIRKRKDKMNELGDSGDNQ